MNEASDRDAMPIPCLGEKSLPPSRTPFVHREERCERNTPVLRLLRRKRLAVTAYRDPATQQTCVPFARRGRGEAAATSWAVGSASRFKGLDQVIDPRAAPHRPRLPSRACPARRPRWVAVRCRFFAQHPWMARPRRSRGQCAGSRRGASAPGHDRTRRSCQHERGVDLGHFSVSAV